MPCFLPGPLWILACTALGSASAGGTDAAVAGLSDVVPDDALAALLVDPRARAGHARSTLDVAAEIVGGVSRMGLLSPLPRSGRLAFDAFATLPVLSRRPFAIVLSDIRAMHVGRSGHRLARMQIGLILQTTGDNGDIAAAIQRFLDQYTDAACCTVGERTRETKAVFGLTNRYWPKWARVEWGAVGNYYLITLGSGAFDRLARTLVAPPSSSVVPEQPAPAFAERRRPRKWLSAALETLDAGGATWAWYVDFQKLRRALRPALGPLPDRVLSTLGYDGVERAVWAVIPDRRALRVESLRRARSRDRRIRIATPATDAELAGGWIPRQADRYALLRWNAESFVSRVRDAWLEVRSPENQRRLRNTWSVIEEQLGFSIEHDLLRQIGPRLLIHTFPRHPLEIGLLCTVQIQISGSSRLVRSRLDALLTYWRRTQLAGGRPPLIERADDGTWYLRFGVYGPAVAVVDHWIIISFSPRAVRQNVARLGGWVAGRPSERTNP